MEDAASVMCTRTLLQVSTSASEHDAGLAQSWRGSNFESSSRSSVQRQVGIYCSPRHLTKMRGFKMRRMTWREIPRWFATDVARHVLVCHLTHETWVQYALDDVAGNIYLSLAGGRRASTQSGGGGAWAQW